MANTNPYPKTRLFVEYPLEERTSITLEDKQAHYIVNVLRLQAGDSIALFNGKDGEWSSRVQNIRKKSADLLVTSKIKPQYNAPDIWLCFAPVKHGKIDLLAQKSTELGVSRLCPIMTERTIVSRINLERMRANAIEAAEQCGRLDIPEIAQPLSFTKTLSTWNKTRTILHADESGGGNLPHAAVAPMPQNTPYAIFTGPEGGFTRQEQNTLRSLDICRPITLGPRILRAETAAIAAITCVMAVVGDWRNKPDFHTEE